MTKCKFSASTSFFANFIEIHRLNFASYSDFSNFERKLQDFNRSFKLTIFSQIFKRKPPGQPNSSENYFAKFFFFCWHSSPSGIQDPQAFRGSQGTNLRAQRNFFFKALSIVSETILPIFNILLLRNVT